MSKPVIEVQVRGLAATSGGCAVFLGNEDNGRFADYFIHLLPGVKLRDAPVESTIWIQRI